MKPYRLTDAQRKKISDHLRRIADQIEDPTTGVEMVQINGENVIEQVFNEEKGFYEPRLTGEKSFSVRWKFVKP